MTKLLNADQLARKLGLNSRRALSNLLNRSPHFPPSMHIGVGDGDRWREADVDAWIDQQFEDAKTDTQCDAGEHVPIMSLKECMDAEEQS